MPYQAEDSEGQKDLNGLAARFIAETNAFLDRFWAHPGVCWPLKGGGAPPEVVDRAPADPAMSIGLSAVPELVARLKRLHSRPCVNPNGEAAGDAGEPGVYLILVLVPEEPPLPAAALVGAGRLASRESRPSSQHKTSRMGPRRRTSSAA